MKKHVFTFGLLVLINSANAQLTSSSQKKAAAFNKTEVTYRQVQKELQDLEVKRKELFAQLAAFDKQAAALTLKVQKLENTYDSLSGGNGQSQLLNATKQMQETQMSFNLQYLQLQSQMQHENRSYTAVSNIMKTKHDTVKNSISNVR